MDIEGLISNVQLSRPIWDKRIKEHSNRNIVDACWRKISSEMKTDGAVLRKKWKYLRDQFSVECSKIKTPRSGDAAETATEPKWPYFKQLLFLKDIVTPRASSSNLKPKVPSVIDDGEVERELDVSLCADELETDNNGLNVGLTERETPNENVTEPQPAELNQTANPPASQPRKRRRVMATNTLYNEKILKLEQQKIDTIQSAFQREPDNDDLMFFRSLLPFVSEIPTEKKLRFRSRIQQVVEEFAYLGGRPLQRPSPGPSAIASTPLPSPDLSTSSYDSRPSPVDINYHQMLPTTRGAFPQNHEAFPGSSTFAQSQNMYNSDFEHNF